jgi:hypothetical protein
LIEWLAAADLIVHEVTTMTEKAVHTPYKKLAVLPPSLRSKIWLTHYPDHFDADRRRGLVARPAAEPPAHRAAAGLGGARQPPLEHRATGSAGALY